MTRFIRAFRRAEEARPVTFAPCAETHAHWRTTYERLSSISARNNVRGRHVHVTATQEQTTNVNIRNSSAPKEAGARD